MDIVVYLVTTIYRNGHNVLFNPTMDTEIFPSYIDALRWVSSDNRILKRSGYQVSHFQPKHRPEYGRCELFKLIGEKGPFKEEIIISRVVTKGLH